MLSRILLIGACCATVLMLAACGGGKGLDSLESSSEPAVASADPLLEASPLPAVAAAPGTDFTPLPGDTPREAATAPSDEDRLQLGEQWEAALSNKHVAGGIYSPEYAGAAGRTIDDTAYAIYRFSNLAGYAGKAQIQLGWDPAMDQAKDVYLALANYQTQRWDWFKFPASMTVNLGSFSDYVNTGQASYAAILSLDNGSFGLEYVLAGTNTLPLADITSNLNANPLLNLAPVVVSFNASNSRSYGGTIDSYDFDWEGDGSWDVQGNLDGLAIHQFPAGNYDTTVRVTDNLGQTALGVLSFAAIDPNNHAPAASFESTPGSGEGPLLVQFDASASSDAMGGYITKYEWDFIPGGGYEYVSDSPLASFTFAIAGNNPVTLRVTDNFLATNSVAKYVTLTKGWHRNIVVNNTETRARMALCTTGTGSAERACLAYQDFNLHELRFVRAGNLQTSSWSAFIKPVNSVNETGYSPSIDVAVGGAPIICYGEGFVGKPLWTVMATDETGASWNTPKIVAGSSNLGNSASMAVINTFPCVAAYDDTAALGIGKIVYMQAQDPQGLAWYPAQDVMTAPPGYKFRYLTLGKSSKGLFKRPVIACGLQENVYLNKSAIVAAANIDGTAWNTPSIYPQWSKPDRIMNLNGRPACSGASSGLDDHKGLFARANDGDGSSWPADYDVISDEAIITDMQVVDGKPFICYQTLPSSRIYARAALDADGSSWSEPYVICDSAGDLYSPLGMTVVGGKPVICFNYYSAGTKAIYSLSWY